MINITKTREKEKVIIGLSGRLDASNAQQLQDILFPLLDEVKHIELDCTGLEFVASAGLRVLFSGYKTAKIRQIKYDFKNVTEEVVNLFKMTGFFGVFHII